MLRAKILVALLLTVGGARAAGAQGPFGQPLTPEQVACEERQLERLQHRAAAGDRFSNLFFWRSSAAGGTYRGLAAGSQLGGPRGNRGHIENQLAFDLVLKDGEDFLNPRRLLLPQATLVRRDAASNVVSDSAPLPGLAMTFDLAPSVPDPTHPMQALRIDDQPAAGGGHDDGAGRGLATDDLITPCHDQVSDFDLKVFSILARTVRVAECLLEPVPDCLESIDRHRLTLFRGEEPLTYRINVFTYFIGCPDDDGGECVYGEERVALLVRLAVDSAGRLTGGTIEALPWCTVNNLGCTNESSPLYAVYVLPPMIPGVGRQGEAEFLRSAHLNLVVRNDPANVLADTIHWTDLLRDTAWQ